MINKKILLMCVCLTVQNVNMKPKVVKQFEHRLIDAEFEEEMEKNVEDEYTAAELDLIYRVVEAEMGCCDTKEKSYVASVIFNMINHPKKRFGATVKSIIKCPNRFCISRSKKVSQSTKDAVQMAYEENTAPGCYAFNCHKRHGKKFAGWKYKFTDKYGVNYYGE